MAEERPPEWAPEEALAELFSPPSIEPESGPGAPALEEAHARAEAASPPAPPPRGPRMVSVRLSHLFVLAVALAFVGGFAVHAALFPRDLPSGFISDRDVQRIADLADRVEAEAKSLSDSVTPQPDRIRELGRSLQDAASQLKALAAGLEGGTAAAAPSPTSAPPARAQVPNGIDDDYTEGDRNAKVQFIEFSDFQCPFCRRFYTQSLSQVVNDYVKTGKVLYAYRDFPLDQIHPAATPWAIAAECAKEQGKWRELHDKIFDEQNKQGQGTISYPDPVSVVKQWAQEIGLDAGSFNICLDSQKYLSEVQKDLQDGLSAGVSGTPTFFIGNPQRGYVQIVGAQPYVTLKQAIESELAAT